MLKSLQRRVYRGKIKRKIFKENQVSSISNFSGQDQDTEFPLKKSVYALRDFNRIIYSLLKDVNFLLQDSTETVKKMREREDKDLHEIMIATDKIGLGLELAVAAKTKIVESYCY